MRVLSKADQPVSVRIFLFIIGVVILAYCSLEITRTLLWANSQAGPIAITTYLQIPILVLFLGGAHYYFGRAANESADPAAMMNGILRHADVGIAMIDKKGIIESTNSKFDEIFEYLNGELEGKDICTLVREKNRNGIQASIRSFDQDSGADATATAIRVEGIRRSWSRVMLEMKILPAQDQSQESLVVMALDVSRESRMEKELLRLQDALDQSDEAVIIADEEGVVEYINAAARDIASNGQSLKGSRLKANMAAGDDERENRGMWDTVRIGRIWKSEIAVEGKGADRRYEEVFVYPVKDGEGQITNYLAIRRDISSRKRSEKIISNLTRAIEHSADMIMVTDTHGVIEYVNPAVLNTTGYNRGELIGGDPGIFGAGQNGDSGRQRMWDQIKAGKAWSGRIASQKKSGDVMEEELNVSPVFDEKGNVVNFVVVGRDITETIRSEKELLARKEEAEASNRFKDELISIVSHDLKNPIIASLGLVELVKNDQKREVDPFHHEILGRIASSGERALEMIEKLLLMSPSRFGKWELEKKFFNVYALVDQVIDELESMARMKQVPLENSLPKNMRLQADYDLYHEVVSNLILNAIKFSPGGREVTICAAAGKTGAVEIRDKGIGVPESLLPNIFSKDVVTTMEGTAGEKGYGMGLPFCHEVMTKHGGNITVEPRPGGGSVFTISLPVSKPLVMLVDDDEDFRLLLKELLDSMDVDTTEALNGAQALDLIDNKIPCLLITDLFMEPMNGFDLLKELKKRNCHIAKIAVTSDTQIDTRNRAFASGAQDFVTKPLVAYDFIPRVKRLLEVGLR
ncbi:MAG: PAS domain S-box protein [Nitrospinota bacterium]|nr:PAS domain S-box protein [Nitrospinota bacterium]